MIILKIERRCSFTDEIKNIKKVFLLNIFRVISPSSGVYRLKLLKIERRCSFTDEIKNIKKSFFTQYISGC